ncbi:DUF4867 family protein [Metabacillus litoralis]|uniref:DUF4867 family protein n=1 Tax=Metabacillus litoralis TaxID=152268 RepID=A0A5C6VFN9_9BACI|nr:DUF4867 family protein [Metabacillus litoralis]TXC82198.1 DUF4867 family protein [Metabacillus litoralis]
MGTFETLCKQNHHLNFFHVEEETFAPFGRIISGLDIKPLTDFMSEQTLIPDEGNVYEPSIFAMEEFMIKKQIETELYGEMPIQIGYCNGRNSNLNGLEFHKGNELNIAVTDMVLLLGKVQDIKKNQYNAKDVQAFYIPMGTIIELYATTLHFAPCKTTDNGFKCIVVLPKETNLPLDNTINQRDRLLFMKNKWLLAHPDNKRMIDRGAYPGIHGENLVVNY